MARPSIPVRGPLAARLREASDAETSALRAHVRAEDRLEQLIAKAREEGYSVRAIASALGRSRAYVERAGKP